MPSLSVLLCTRNRSDKIMNAVNSILSNSFTDFELIVVDQSSDRSTGILLENHADSRVKYTHSDTVGLARSRNTAIRLSSAEIVVFTDDDCICDKNWLLSINREFELDDTIMGVYGRVLPHGNGHPERICQCLMDSWERRTVDRPVIPYGILGHGNNMSFRKDVFRKIGLYIESLGAGTWMKGGEDTELTYRALRRNMKFVYTPIPLVYHDNWLTLDRSMELDCNYTFSAIAVFTKFTLYLDHIAACHVVRRGLDIMKDLARGRDMSLKKIGLYLMGLLMGIKYLFVTPPKLTP